MAGNFGNRRQQPRREVNWTAEFRLGGTFAEGLIRDISQGGAFFSPAADEVTDAHSEHALAFVEPGDTVLLKYAARPDDEPVTVLATVRWIGKSDTHEVPGAGVAFERLD